ncbi:hypothetical protein SAMN05421739_10121 [Pontibacter chinhatensis]|uniref:Uncharacterized protein n=1 Tax=Pontibacter chinhatensis TaxID=1436961 RepID=A0A1I2LYI0_9BACT|nr:hypothetical protein SAMN05421739_10121 [Pontibacter chinhatensis]
MPIQSACTNKFGCKASKVYRISLYFLLLPKSIELCKKHMLN